MRADVVRYEVVGRPETARARKRPRKRALCVHDRPLRVGIFDASASYGSTRRARRIDCVSVTVGGSKQLRRPTSNFGRNSTKFCHRSRVDLDMISVGSRFSGRSRINLGSISD